MGLNRLQLFYEKNQDFISLSANDRLVLLSNTFKHTGCICTNFILYKVGITDYSMYYDAITKISNEFAAIAAKRLSVQLDFDIIIAKLLLAILSFSTINYTTYSNISSNKIHILKSCGDIYFTSMIFNNLLCIFLVLYNVYLLSMKL